MRFDIRRFDSLDSTNRYALDEARRDAPEGVVAVADHQTAGRGRRGRVWQAPPGSSLLVSVLLRPNLPPERAALATMVAALAMADAVEATTGVAADVKWPNDLVVGDRKLGGLLAETETAVDGTVSAVVIGIGVNLNWRALPAELAETATACNLLTGHAVDRDAVLDGFLANLATRYEQLDRALPEYRARLATIGRRVRVERDGADSLVGKAADVGPNGELVLETEHGRIAVRVGDVVHLRDA
jgi:BirA family biotin operon repressor/biotin-[acetyl-CoA-carboxylase] ligase